MDPDKNNEEMEKFGVQCKRDHTKTKGEMEKTGSSECKCPHCGDSIKTEEKK